MAHPLLPREELIERLGVVFRQHGYEGASLSLLSAATGLGRASLYYQFPRGKEDMANAVLDATGLLFSALVIEPLAGPGIPRARLRRVAAGLTQFYRDGHQACLIDVFGIGEAGQLFRPRLSRNIDALKAALARLLVEAGIDATDAAHRAEDIVIAIQGALVIARVTGTNAGFERVLAELPDRLLGKSRRAKPG
jgi:AcrR family transcriptional regulator